jgi:hypothetical protein
MREFIDGPVYPSVLLSVNLCQENPRPTVALSYIWVMVCCQCDKNNRTILLSRHNKFRTVYYKKFSHHVFDNFGISRETKISFQQGNGTTSRMPIWWVSYGRFSSSAAVLQPVVGYGCLETDWSLVTRGLPVTIICKEGWNTKHIKAIHINSDELNKSPDAQHQNF